MISCKTFEHNYQVTDFCNENNITKNEIIALFFSPELLFSYCLFYEINS